MGRMYYCNAFANKQYYLQFLLAVLQGLSYIKIYEQYIEFFILYFKSNVLLIDC